MAEVELTDMDEWTRKAGKKTKDKKNKKNEKNKAEKVKDELIK